MPARYVFLLIIFFINTMVQYVICGIAISRITKNYKNPSNPVVILKSREAIALIFLLIADYVLGFLFVFLNHRLIGGNAEAIMIALRAIGCYTILPYNLVIVVLTLYLLLASYKHQKGNYTDNE